jgi:N-acyl-D-aspartate/D-glutamate deacylase
MHDILIRGGTVVDGSGKPRFGADLGIKDGRIVEIGRIRQNARRTIDADGLIVAPGFIDGHTHMDAQVAWDPLGSCSCWHGVTSVVMSNCGFALAPCKPADRDWYARCLSAVEDIPTEAMAAGIDWTWETFPEYLATVERLPKAINYGMYIGHSALRMYVMGKRALSEAATDDDMTRMANTVREALKAGALGFSSSRASTHVTPDDTPVASRIAVGGDRPLLAPWPRRCRHLPGRPRPRQRHAHAPSSNSCSGWRCGGRPMMFGSPPARATDESWQAQVDFIDRSNAMGAKMWGQSTTKSINALFSLKSYLPFDVLPAWREVRSLPLAEQRRRLADPAVRARLIADEGREVRDNVFQGAAARPRRKRHATWYANGWDDDLSIERLRERQKHPVDVISTPASKRTRSTSSRWSTIAGSGKHPRHPRALPPIPARVRRDTYPADAHAEPLRKLVRSPGTAVKKLTADTPIRADRADRGKAVDIVVSI